MFLIISILIISSIVRAQNTSITNLNEIILQKGEDYYQNEKLLPKNVNPSSKNEFNQENINKNGKFSEINKISLQNKSSQLKINDEIELLTNIKFKMDENETKSKENEIFQKFLHDFNINPSTIEDYEASKMNLIENYKKINSHNQKQEKTYTMSLSKHSHMSDEFVLKNLAGVKATKNIKVLKSDEIVNENSSEREDLPESFNWIEKNVLQPIQNQGSCSSCYVFSAVSVIEARMAIKHGKSEKLSEQEAMECTRGCDGGEVIDIYDYSTKYNGCKAAEFSPYYETVKSRCRAEFSFLRESKSKVRSSHRITSGDEKEIMKYLIKFGPLSAYMMTNIDFSHLSSGIFNENVISEDWHGVVIVGYGRDEKSDLNYWIVRNSWGTTFGEDGYFRIERGKDLCGIESTNVMYVELYD